MGAPEPLRAVALFSQLTDEQLDRVAKLGRVEDVAAGQILFRQGDPGLGLSAVISGRLRVDRRIGDDESSELFSVGPGGSVGEPALFDGRPRVATVTAVEDSRLYVLDRDPFLAFISGAPEVLAPILSGLSETLRSSYDQMFSEVLERRVLENAIKAERYRSLAQLVAGVAHELNTPLGVVSIAASIVVDELNGLRERKASWDDSAVTDAIEASVLIQRNLARANTLVQSFKSLSVRQAVDQVAEVDLAGLISEVLLVYSPQARAERLEIEVRDLRADRLSPWTGSASSLTQVLLNLLTNAGRYAYPGGQGGAIEILIEDACIDRVESIALTVRDFGQGIPAEDQARVLEPFFTTGRGRGGTGLGLSIVNTLVSDGMEGDLDLHSIPGQGTTIRMSFPTHLQGQR